MNNTVLLPSLLLFNPNGSPDLCAEPLLGPDGLGISDSTGRYLSRYCEWSGPDVPVWDDDLCCTASPSTLTCTASGTRDEACRSGARYYCEYGERTPTGEVVCYQPWPSACDAGLCVDPPADGPPIVAVTPLVLCCYSNGECVWAGYSSGECEGEILHCFWGMTNEDGTAECFE